MKKINILFLLFALLFFTVKAQPILWGMSPYGGAGNGNMFYSTTGSIFATNTFSWENTGAANNGHLIQTPSGKFYGLGGGGVGLAGVLFEYEPVGNIYSIKHNFGLVAGDGRGPWGSLLMASNGKLYGMTASGGLSNEGTLFEYDIATSTYIKKIDFNSANGRAPCGTLIQSVNGKLYGMTAMGGATNQGTIIEYDILTNTLVVKYSLNSISGIGPYGSLFESSNGKLYGMTQYGGLNNTGTLFKFNKNTNVLSKIIDFSSSIGEEPLGSVIEASNGKIYGLTNRGGVFFAGTIFVHDTVLNNVTKLYDFGLSSGYEIYGSLIQASNGKLYGLTGDAGANNFGTIFEYNITTSAFTKLYDLPTFQSGTNAYGTLMQASNGKLYGMTSAGGIGSGTIFEFDYSSLIYTKKYDFGCINGQFAVGSLIQAKNQKLFGMTKNGGLYGNGTLFQYNPKSYSFNKLIDFTGALGTNGGQPYGSLIQANNYKLYGMTLSGGNTDLGVIFEYDTLTNNLSVIHNFSVSTGRTPFGDLLQASNTKLYGMTAYGGTNNFGTVFEYDLATATYTKLIDFNNTNGGRPKGSLVQASNGKLYGLTSEGGTNNFGVIFEFNTITNTLTKLFDFSSVNGISPEGSLILAGNNLLYGVTRGGGTNSDGVLFEFNPFTNVFTKKIDFSNLMTGKDAAGTLLQSGNGKLYGLTNSGGASNFGTLFEYDIPTSTLVKKIDFSGIDGKNPYQTKLIEICPSQFITATSSASLICSGQSVTITATGASSYTWSTGSVGSSIVVSPTTTTIYTAVGTNSLFCNEKSTVTQSVSTCSSIGDFASENLDFSIYPNPNNGSFCLKINSNCKSYITLFNSIGQKVHMQNVSNGVNKINTNNLSIGLYNIIITEGSQLINLGKVSIE